MTTETQQRLQVDLKMLTSKIADLDTERDEHRLVIETLKLAQPTRSCYRLIDQVLVKQTVEDVIPTLMGNLKGIEEMIQVLAKNYELKEKEFSNAKQ
jgi:prefoldin subunit 2